MIKLLRKHHKWLGIILLIFFVLFSISGIILNHRKTFSNFHIKREYVPGNYSYKDWNFSTVRSTEKIGADSILIYGNIGVWLTDSTFSKFENFNAGFPKGVDNHQVSKVLNINDKQVAIGSRIGLFLYSKGEEGLQAIRLPEKENYITDLIMRDDTLMVLTRSHLFRSTDYQTFEQIDLPAPAHYKNKIGLFKTIWVLHSGELYGLVGRLVVDALGLIMIFLSITGFIIFLKKKKLLKRNIDKAERKRISKQYHWNLKWHNKLGWTTTVLLIIVTATGMFLRPPLLIPIAEAKVSKIPYSLLDTPNPWYDDLRRIIYIEDENRYILSTSETFYHTDVQFSKIEAFELQPPFSVMGVTVLEHVAEHTLWVGSFNGLFSWNYQTDEIYDMIDEQVWVRPTKKSHPVGAHKIVGYSTHVSEKPFVFDYDVGTKNIFNKDEFPAMPKEIIKQNPMPLWNFALEIHTGRIFQFILGQFYLLIIPLTGLFGLYLIIGGFIIWYKKFRN